MDTSHSPSDPLPDRVNPAWNPAAGQPVEAVSAQQEAVQAQRRALLQRGRSGANWFFWIAGLSLVNSVVLLSGNDTHFVIGLGITLMADVIAKVAAENNPNVATLLTAAAFGFDLVVALVMVLFGWLAQKRYQAMFALGMFLYLLDGLLYVWFQDWMSVGFHAFALFCMWSGLSSLRQLNAMERATSFPSFAAVQAPADPPGF